MSRFGRRARAVGCVAVLLLAAAGLSGCGGGGNGELTAYATFSDVDQLVGGAPVDMADIPVGHVVAITLDGSLARVQMAIERSARVPSAVSAEIEQTSVLGDNFVQLVPEAGAAHGPPLAPGETITRTGVRPEIEQLVQGGSQVFGSIPDTELAEIVQAGGQGFGGQSATLRQLLNDFAAVSAGYAANTGDIRSAIVNLDQLATGLAPASGADAQAISNLAATIQVLQSQSAQFLTTLQALDNLSIQGHSLLGGSLPQLDAEFSALAATADELAAHQQDIAGLVQQLPGYNAAANGATMHDFIQVFEDIIICGIPGGGENDSSPATTCAQSGSGK
ncbi:MAG TPA: MlaD family protein [Actinomycetota bacterium]|nr:MlaD family protein [Actinomycetota bacterium]